MPRLGTRRGADGNFHPPDSPGYPAPEADLAGTGRTSSDGEGIADADYVSPIDGEGVGNGAPLDTPQSERRTRRKTPKTHPIDIAGWASVISLAHGLLALVAHAPELVLETKEAEALATASAKVMAHYDIPVISEKWGDWIVLCAVMRNLYAPRFVAIGVRKAMERSVARAASEQDQPEDRSPRDAFDPPFTFFDLPEG